MTGIEIISVIVAVAIVALIGAVVRVDEKRRELEIRLTNLDKTVTGRDAAGWSRRGDTESLVPRVNDALDRVGYLENKVGILRNTIDKLTPLLEAVHEADIREVIKVDYPDYKFSQFITQDEGVKVQLKSKETYKRPNLHTVDRLYADGFYEEYGYKYIKLDTIINRASELRELKKKLCCKKKGK